MNRPDLSVFPLFVDEKMVAFVDYQVCQSCGFRLMRVETTIINDHRIVAQYCPICEHPTASADATANRALTDELRQQNFDTWLATHGLDRESLEKHYHLKTENFFDDIR